MKKRKLLLTATALLAAATAWCADITYGYCEFTITDATAHTVAFTGLTEDCREREVSIPETVESNGVTYTVTSVNTELAGVAQYIVQKVTIPKTVVGIDRIYGINIATIDIAEGSQLRNIGNSAFENLTKISTISLPASVETIGDNAFAGCIKLNDFTLPDGLKALGSGAFGNYSGDITLPAAIDTIGSGAFNLVKVYPTGQTPARIADDAFRAESEVIMRDLSLITRYAEARGWLNYAVHGLAFEQDGLTFEPQSSTAAVIIKAEVATTCTVPKSVSRDGAVLAVTKINDGVFHENIRLVEFKVESDLKSLGSQRFSEMLQKVELPATLERIEDNTFLDCKNLKTISLPGNVEYIGASAFQNSGLTEISLPDNLRYIGHSAFQNSGLTEFTVPQNVKEISPEMLGNCKSLTSLTLHDDITSIGNNAFSFTAIESFSVPSKVTSLSPYVLYGCKSLTSLTLHDNIISIETESLGGTNISELTIPASVSYISDLFGTEPAVNLSNITVDSRNEYYKDIDGILFTKDGTELIYYPYNRNATEYIVPDGVRKIYSHAFSGSTDTPRPQLKKVTLPDGLEAIYNHAFFYNTNLTEVNLPNTLTSIGSGAFNGTFLQNLTIPANVKDFGIGAFNVLFARMEHLTPPANSPFQHNNVVICVKPEALEAFKQADRQWNYHIYVTDIHEDNGFLYTELSENEAELASHTVALDGKIYIPATATINGTTHNVVSIGQSALAGQRITEPVIPESVRTIGRNALRENPLKTLFIPRNTNMDVINDFIYCYTLESITADPQNPYYTTEDGVLYSKDVDTLLMYPASRASSTYILPESVKKINEYAFYFSTSAVASDGVYFGTTTLKSFYSLYKNNIPEIYAPSGFHIVFFYPAPTTTLYVPAKYLESYKSTTGWVNFSEIVGLSDDEIDEFLTSVKEVTADTRRADDGAYFTLSGVRVTKPGKGIYIHNGRKVVIR